MSTLATLWRRQRPSATGVSLPTRASEQPNVFQTPAPRAQNQCTTVGDLRVDLRPQQPPQEASRQQLFQLSTGLTARVATAPAPEVRARIEASQAWAEAARLHSLLETPCAPCGRNSRESIPVCPLSRQMNTGTDAASPTTNPAAGFDTVHAGRTSEGSTRRIW